MTVSPWYPFRVELSTVSHLTRDSCRTIRNRQNPKQVTIRVILTSPSLAPSIREVYVYHTRQSGSPRRSGRFSSYRATTGSTRVSCHSCNRPYTPQATYTLAIYLQVSHTQVTHPRVSPSPSLSQFLAAHFSPPINCQALSLPSIQQKRVSTKIITTCFGNISATHGFGKTIPRLTKNLRTQPRNNIIEQQQGHKIWLQYVAVRHGMILYRG